jgi:hypothetical protein
MTPTISISLNDEGVECTTELSTAELIFWLEYVKLMILNGAKESEGEGQPS